MTENEDEEGAAGALADFGEAGTALGVLFALYMSD
jgi:hypothetical protein